MLNKKIFSCLSKLKFELFSSLFFPCVRTVIRNRARRIWVWHGEISEFDFDCVTSTMIVIISLTRVTNPQDSGKGKHCQPANTFARQLRTKCSQITFNVATRHVTVVTLSTFLSAVFPWEWRYRSKDRRAQNRWVQSKKSAQVARLHFQWIRTTKAKVYATHWFLIKFPDFFLLFRSQI